MSRDAKFSSSPPTVPHLRGTRTVHGDRTSSVARSTSRTGKCSRSVVLMQSRNRARRSMRAASVGPAHPRPPGDANASAQSPTSGARAGALGCGGRELMRRGARQLKAADDLAERPCPVSQVAEVGQEEADLDLDHGSCAVQGTRWSKGAEESRARGRSCGAGRQGVGF